MTESPVAPKASDALATGWYAVTTEEVTTKLDVDPAKGLSAAKAAGLLTKNGPNALPAEATVPGWRQFLAQYRSYMQIILVAAAVASMLIGQIATGVVVLAITALNALGGMRQQGKAESAMNALQSMLKASARVRRDGAEVEIDGDQVVVGDVVLLAAGDQVCADGRIIEAASLQIDESGLTGESVPASKSAEVIADDPKPGVGDQSNMAFMNSPVTHGSGVMIVTGTGADTEVGKISGLLKSTPTLKTPLTAQLDTLTLWIAGAAGLTIAIMFALGISRDQSTQTIFTTSIALALAAVPMAMPTVLQVILSRGSTNLAAQGAVVKNLASVETLGSTSAINSDKTGTLTLNQVTVVEVIDPTDRYEITGMGYGLEGEVNHTAGNTNTIEQAILPFLLANDAKLVDGKVVGDPTEGALLILGYKARLDVESTQAAYPRLATLPFDPTYKLMAVFADAKDESGKAVVRAFVKGAGPAVIGRAASALANGKNVPWGDDESSRAAKEMDRLGGQGLRIMAAATRDIDPADFHPEGDLLSLVTGLQMTAIVGMIDPPRAESKDAVRNAQNANIRVRMVTGDDVVTGAAIATQLGIPGEAILGADFAAMSEDERLARIDKIGVVGRVAPEHKVLMVNTLQRKGDVVAMTGDGVNDAPALKRSDIGVAMGITGTEVTKEAADMILTDDNFATIVKAVEIGRGLYDNLTKYVRFQIGILAGMVLSFLGAAIFNVAGGVLFIPLQTLWLNFTTQVFQAVGLGYGKFADDLMERKPRNPNDEILDRLRFVWIAIAGLVMAIGTVGIAWWADDHHGADLARTMALTTFSIANLFFSFTALDEKRSVFSMESFADRKFLFATGLSVVAIVLGTEMDVFNRFIGTTGLTRGQWGVCLIVPFGVVLASEAWKWYLRRREPAAA